MDRAPLGAAWAACGAWLRDDRATVDEAHTSGTGALRSRLRGMSGSGRGRYHRRDDGLSRTVPPRARWFTARAADEACRTVRG